MSDLISFDCPWCHGTIQVASNQINCRIFRHAVYRRNGEPVDPHMRQEPMQQLIERSEIWGCGNPIRLGQDNLPTMGVWSD